MMSSTILNATVANQTRKAVNDGSSNGSGYVENNKTRQDDRDEMWLGFFIGLMFGAFYLLGFSGSKLGDSFLSAFLDGAYLLAYFISQSVVYTVSQDKKQPKQTIKTALILSAMLSVVMLVPFIMDMDMNFHVHEFVAGGGGYIVGQDVHISAIYHDYVDYGKIICVAVMCLWCISDVLMPLIKLRKMKKELD